MKPKIAEFGNETYGVHLRVEEAFQDTIRITLHSGYFARDMGALIPRAEWDRIVREMAEPSPQQAAGGGNASRVKIWLHEWRVGDLARCNYPSGIGLSAVALYGVDDVQPFNGNTILKLRHGPKVVGWYFADLFTGYHPAPACASRATSAEHPTTFSGLGGPVSQPHQWKAGDVARCMHPAISSLTLGRRYQVASAFKDCFGTQFIRIFDDYNRQVDWNASNFDCVPPDQSDTTFVGTPIPTPACGGPVTNSRPAEPTLAAAIADTDHLISEVHKVLEQTELDIAISARLRRLQGLEAAVAEMPDAAVIDQVRGVHHPKPNHPVTVGINSLLALYDRLAVVPR